METILEILDKKGREIYSVTLDTTVFKTPTQMAENNIGAVFVIEGKVNWDNE